MKIGVFDSGYGGLTILREIRALLPQYDYIYLGDNARAPYGTRSFDIVYDFTLQAVEALFALDCRLVILACNTASAKALRSIQQNDLVKTPLGPDGLPLRRVLGVIRPTIEILPSVTRTGHIGLLATSGTVASHSYLLELEKIAPQMTITELPCPMWVPLVECGEADSPGADYFVQKYLRELLTLDPAIDTIVLGCTHYPLLLPKIQQYLSTTQHMDMPSERRDMPSERRDMPSACTGAPVPSFPNTTNQQIRILAQGQLVAESLADYIQRLPEIETSISRGGTIQYLTTENPAKFDALATLFLSTPVSSTKITL